MTKLLTSGIKEVKLEMVNLERLKFFCKKGDDYFFNKHAENTVTGTNGRHIFIDNGSSVLAVAHIDTVVNPRKTFSFNTMTRNAGPTDVLVVKTPTLDDRLGVYTIMDFLPGILGEKWADILITEGEETGKSTAQDFKTDKQYNWMVEFDRNGSGMTYMGNSKTLNDDAVLYSFKGKDFEDALRDSGFERLGRGSLTDICYLHHLKCKAFNVAVGYHDNHSTKAYMYVEEYVRAMNLFIAFYTKHKDTMFEHVYTPPAKTQYKYKTGGYAQNWNKTYKKNNGVYGSYQPPLASGWIADSPIKPGDLVRHYAAQGQLYIVHQVHKMPKASDCRWKYDLAWLDGKTCIKGLPDYKIERALDVCIYCLFTTDNPIEFPDTDNSTIIMCPQCYSLIIDTMIECDFCGDSVNAGEITSMGDGYISCIGCKDFISDYRRTDGDNSFLIPGDIVRPINGCRLYEVIDLIGDGNITLLALDTSQSYSNSGIGYPQEIFQLVSVVEH